MFSILHVRRGTGYAFQALLSNDFAISVKTFFAMPTVFIFE